MKRIVLLLLIILVLLPIVCLFLNPKLTVVDFLTLDLTIFSISVLLVTFTAPYLMRFRDMLLDTDVALLKKDKAYLDFLQSHIDILKTLDAMSPQDQHKENIHLLEDGKNKYRESIKNPFPLSDTIQNYYKGTKNIMMWCLVAISLHILFNEILFTSDSFSSFVRNDLSCLSSYMNMSYLKLFLSSYIKLSSLTLQLFFLFRTSEDTISAITSFRSLLVKDEYR